MQEGIAGAYGEWLDSFRWTWWTTLTFRKPLSPVASLRHYHRFTRWLDNATGGGGGYFVGSETGGLLGRTHLHSLVFIPPLPLRPTSGDEWDPLRSVAWRWWFNRYGRALILPFEEGKGATHYITKYVGKDLAEWDIGGNLEHHGTIQPNTTTGKPRPGGGFSPTR